MLVNHKRDHHLKHEPPEVLLNIFQFSKPSLDDWLVFLRLQQSVGELADKFSWIYRHTHLAMAVMLKRWLSTTFHHLDHPQPPPSLGQEEALKIMNMETLYAFKSHLVQEVEGSPSIIAWSFVVQVCNT